MSLAVIRKLRSGSVLTALEITDVTMLCSGEDMATPVRFGLHAETALHHDACYFIKFRVLGSERVDCIVRCDIRHQGTPSFHVLFERKGRQGEEYNQFHPLPPVDTTKRESEIKSSFLHPMRSEFLMFFRFSPRTEELLRAGKTPQQIVEELNAEQSATVCALSGWRKKGQTLDPEMIRIILMYLGIIDKETGKFTNKRGGKRSYRNKSYKKKNKSKNKSKKYCK